MKTKTAKVQTVKAGTRMIAVKDEQGNTLREFPASTWEPAGGFPRPEVQSTEVVFTADVEGVPSQIMWKDINSDEEKPRRMTVDKHQHADPATLGYSSFAQKFFIIIRCVKCGAARRVWTSDLFQCSKCEKCQSFMRRERQREKRAEMRQI